MIGALMLAVLGLKVPHWLGLYPKSGLHLIDDTSNLAKQAVQDLVGSIPRDGEGEGCPEGSITDFRYQVRIAMGKHFAKFCFFLLPFYVGLKVWWFFVSVLIGYVFGYTYLYVVYKSRKRFRKHRGKVALLASAYMSIVSALMLMEGMSIANESWNLHFARRENGLMFVSFFGWFGICLLLQAANYYLNYTFKDRLPRPSAIERFSIAEINHSASLFDDTGRGGITTETNDLLEALAEGDEENEEGDGDGLGEPLMVSGRRTRFQKGYRDDANVSFFYRTGYFDPSSVSTTKELLERVVRGSVVETSSSKETYDLAVAQDGEPAKSYSSIWRALPFKPLCDIFVLGYRETFPCCYKNADFQKRSCCDKFVFMISRTVGILLNMLALYVALVACLATLQITNTKAKLPFVHEKLYKHMDSGPVCAFENKGGDIKTFSSEEDAHQAHYQIAHCGACGNCSNWIDLELQWSTRNSLAQQSQKCGIKTLGRGIHALQECLESPMIGGTHGFTTECAKCWAEDIFCTKSFCIFIYLQTRMTNQVGNFKVGPDSITSATCEEANCEAGNPGHFVPCVGANRRRMNITSDIARPGAQQCQIVDVHSWNEFFPPQI
eukprot:CCRYP_013714-RA/>CCRYP_013714-RA protein AED:0.06 eAED:0.06 QI:468/1/1/1/0.85/0.75/8/1701/607